MPNTAQGIPDRSNYGDLSKLDVGQLVDWIVQRHDAERAGRHYDVRLGNKDLGLYSWAVRKGLPQIGQKHLAVQQPIHSHQYGSFQGRIESGYGKGSVTQKDKGEVLITKSSPTSIHFTVAHKGTPERFVLAKANFKSGNKDKNWLLLNVTPNQAIPYDKKRYTTVPADKVESLLENLPEGTSVQPKVDGAAVLMPILKDKLEVVSYRQSKKTGGPIVHTERVFGDIPKINPPKDLIGTILRGETYASDKTTGKALDPRRLSPLLNSSVAKSIRDQKDRNIELKTMLFDIQQLGKRPVYPDIQNYDSRYELLQKILPHLPQNKVHLAPQYKGKEAVKSLWDRIKTHKEDLSREGVVIHPPTGTPIKTKLMEDSDVHVAEIFPGEGKYKGLGAGGFTYSLEPGGKVVGRVGTGLTDELRKSMFTNPDDYIGRVARIAAQEQFPSGAYRAPALKAFHEDYPKATITPTAY